MKKLKYIFCDLDGTLLDDKKTISLAQAAYLRNLREKKGIRFGFASGRTLNSLLPIAEKTGLLEVCDVFVANNGVDIYDVKEGKNTQTLLVSVEDIRRIIELLDPYKDFINVIFHNRGGLYGLYETERIRNILKINNYVGLHSPYKEEFDAAARVTLVFSPERLSDVKEVLADCELPPEIQCCQSDTDIIDLARRGVSKAKAIETYAARYSDTLEDVIVFGDSGNDREMMESAGVSVAMKNATEEIRQIADYITEKTNNEDGVMDFLKTIEERF